MGSWYPGTVVFVHIDEEYDVAYDDNDAESNVPLGNLRAIGGASLLPPPPLPPKRLAVGDVVEVNYNASGEWYPGVITRVGPDRLYDVQYDDGEHGTNIRKRLIRYIRGGETAWKPQLAVGTRVEVKYRGRSVWFPATIRNIGPNNVFDVTYDNGEWEPVDRDLIRLVDEERLKDLERSNRLLEEANRRKQEKRERQRQKAAEKVRQETQTTKEAAYRRAAELARNRDAARIADEERLKIQRRQEASKIAQRRADEDARIASARNAEDDAMDTVYLEDIKSAEALGKLHSVVDDARAKAKQDRIDVLNLLDTTMQEEIEFMKNDRRITTEGHKVVDRVAEVLLQYPELQIHIEGHTKCINGVCSGRCPNTSLSQGRVDNVKEALDKVGCKNVFMTRGWGCKHPEVGAQRAVRIFPEDLDYEDEQNIKLEFKRKAEVAAKATEAEIRRINDLLKTRRAKLMKRREKEDALRDERRKAEDKSREAEYEALDIRSSLQKARQDRIDALNLIEDTLREELDFTVNDSSITVNGYTVCRKVAKILMQYPELQIHIESHTSCKPGHCDPECKLQKLSQERVDSVRDALVQSGCANMFITKGWGCKHPKVGAERVVKIFPEDLEYTVDDDTLRVAEKKAHQASKATKAVAAKMAKEVKFWNEEREEEDLIAERRAEEDAKIATQRKFEDDARSSKFAQDIKEAKLRGKMHNICDKARAKAKQDRIDALNLIEDTMREEITFVKNEADITFDGYEICKNVAAILLQYPELLIHIDGHTSCRSGVCGHECKLIKLSQARVERVRDALLDSGCENSFIPQGWGCKHPEVGSERKVSIYPEDLDWEEEERARLEDERKIKDAVQKAADEARRLTEEMNQRELRLGRQREEEDARRASLRKAEDEERSLRRLAERKAAKEKAMKDRIAALNEIEDTMREEINFVRNECTITPEGHKVVDRVAGTLNKFPELQIHIDGHSFCKKGHCSIDCKLLKLSQGRVDTVRDALVRAGCTNIFLTEGWGCRHPEVGAVRAVKIYPEDVF